MSMGIPEDRVCDQVVPETVEILGDRPRDGEAVAEADVRFKDNCGNDWYITVVDGDQHVSSTLQQFEEATPEAIVSAPDTEAEPPVFVWNGRLTEANIPEILGRQSMALLRPFLVPYHPELDDK